MGQTYSDTIWEEPEGIVTIFLASLGFYLMQQGNGRSQRSQDQMQEIHGNLRARHSPVSEEQPQNIELHEKKKGSGERRLRRPGEASL